MAQKFPEVGLRAVFELTGFNQNYRKYTTLMRDIDRVSKQTAQKASQAGRQMGSGFSQTFGDLAQQSGELDGLSKSISRFSELARASQAEMDKWGPTIQNLQDDWLEASKAFTNLGRNANVNVAVFDHLTQSGLNYADAMKVAGGQIDFSIDAFDKLISRGVDAGDAFQQVSSGAAGASGSVTILGRSFSIMAVAAGASIAVLKVGVAVVRQSIEDYEELAEATRRVSLQTGLLTREASSWVQVAQSAGLSTATSERAMTSFLSKVADMRREQLLGEQSTSQFAQAVQTLGISIVGIDGNLKSTDQLLSEINKAFQELGPGIVSAQLATDLFGYSGRFLLPVLVDQEKSMADVGAQAQSLGATLTSLDREGYEELRQANVKLQQAFQGIKNEIARGWVPTITAAKNALADFLNFFRQADARMRAATATLSAMSSGQLTLAEATKYYADQLQFFLSIENDAARSAEETGQARANAAQQSAAEVAAAEQKIQEARQETIEQLDALKTGLAQKLSDINRDAARQWNDILVERQRDAMDRALQLAWRLDDLRAAYNDRLDAIEADFAKRWDDILVKRQRDALERAMRLAWQYEDLTRATEQRRQDVLRDYAGREAKQRQDTQRRIQEAEQDAREKREKLEREHQRRLANIQLDFLDTAQEAARRNDAVAVARAMRERARAIRDEEIRHSDEQRDLVESLAKKRRDIEQDRKQREADQRRELAEELRRIEENHQRQIEENKRQQERERILREQQYAWEREDFEKAKAEQIQAAKDRYTEQLEELKKAQERENILRQIQYERQRQDFTRNWQRRVGEARRWYQQELNDLATHLNMTGQMLEQAYANWMQQASTAAQHVATTVATGMARWASEITRYQQYLTAGQRASVGQSLRSGSTISMAEGGVVQASSPTTVVMGDNGPETGVFMPGRAGSMNVNHNFGRMGVDFQGLPGGMNTQQVQAIVYSVMTQLAKGIQVPRT